MAGNVPVGKDDNVAFLAWSNVATTMHGNVWFLADGQKKPVQLSTPDFATGSTRALTSATVKIPTNGTIIGVSTVAVSGGATQRGQLFVECLLTGATVNNVTVEQTLAQGYVYTGQVLGLGQIVEPGPAGGQGNQTSAPTDNPAAGVQHAAVSVPTGAMWRVTAYREVVTAFTAAAKSISIRTAANIVLGASANQTPAAAAGVIEAYPAAPSTIDTVRNAIVFPMKDTSFLVGGDSLSIVLNGIAGTDDLAAGTFAVEEWVMPN